MLNLYCTTIGGVRLKVAQGHELVTGVQKFKNAPQIEQIFPKLQGYGITLSICQHCSSKPRGAKSQEEPRKFRLSTARVHEGSKSCRCRT